MSKQILKDAIEKSADPLALRRVALAGSLAAISAALLFCRVPGASRRTLPVLALLLLSAKYVAVTVVAGIGCTWAYFRYSTVHPFPVFVALVRSLCIAWLLFPALVLFMWEESLGLLLIAPAVSVAIAISLQELLPEGPSSFTPPEPVEKILFAEPPPSSSGQRTALVSACCIYGAAISVVNQSVAIATILLVICAFLLTTHWQAAAAAILYEPGSKKPSPSTVRLASVAILAVLVTLVALLPWLRIASSSMGIPAAHSSPRSAPRHPASESPADAYHAILLWPFPPKKTPVLPPVPRAITFHASSSASPLIIPFDGSYRYLQASSVWIASRAHVVQGSPLNVNIHSADWGPLLMEAHQQLDRPIDPACCREIQLGIRNGDNRRGSVVLGLVLTDSSRPGKPSQILDSQPVVSSQPGRFTIKSAPTDETLSFAIPAPAKIRHFDEMTVLFLPDPERSAVGAKISVRQFTLVPR
jgi:hypothetical protein